jgi:hypothetical protein
MALPQALVLARLVLEFEAESTETRVWRAECSEAAAVIRAAMDNPPPEWVTRAEPSGGSNFNCGPGEKRRRRNR